MAGRGGGVVTARYFCTVYPEADFAVDGADVVVVPVAVRFGGFGRREAADSVRGGGSEGG